MIERMVCSGFCVIRGSIGVILLVEWSTNFVGRNSVFRWTARAVSGSTSVVHSSSTILVPIAAVIFPSRAATDYQKILHQSLDSYGVVYGFFHRHLSSQLAFGMRRQFCTVASWRLW